MFLYKLHKTIIWKSGTQFALKFLQCVLSIYLIFILYNIGPHWILIIFSFVIPIYGKIFFF